MPNQPQSSSTTLNYRAVEGDFLSDESSSYTDSLWEAALRPSQELRQVSAPLELRPISTPKTKRHRLIETAKAFIPVAVEIGVVAATAANVHLN